MTVLANGSGVVIQSSLLAQIAKVCFGLKYYKGKCGNRGQTALYNRAQSAPSSL